MLRRLTPLLLAVLLQATVAAAQDFKTERLRRAAEVVGVTAALALAPDTTIETKTTKGQVVSIRTDNRQQIVHIGIPLFNADLRLLQPSPVYDFLEYAVLNWKYKAQPNLLYLSKVFFRKGSWDTLLRERLSECDCSISNQDDRFYVVNWQRDGTEVATVVIPIDYELLSNDTRRHIERDFIRLLQTYQPTDSISQGSAIISDDLKIYGTEGLYVLEGKSHTLSELNQNVYYRLTDNPEKGIVPVVVIDQEHPAETFSDLMMADDEIVPDVLMHLDFHLSDYHRQKLDVPLTLLKDYLRLQGWDYYFAYSGISDTIMRGVLFVSNTALACNHLLSLRLPVSQLTASRPEVQADVYLYIPSIEKSNLYGKVPDKKSGAITPH